MNKFILTTKFKKTIKLLQKRGYNISLLKNVIDKLMANQVLPQKYCDHKLTGIYSGFNECHILPDWLLIYKKTTIN